MIRIVAQIRGLVVRAGDWVRARIADFNFPSSTPAPAPDVSGDRSAAEVMITQAQQIIRLNVRIKALEVELENAGWQYSLAVHDHKAFCNEVQCRQDRHNGKEVHAREVRHS